MNTESDIDELLKRWKDTKDQIAELEKKCEKYKKAVEKIMDSQDTNILSSTSSHINISVTRRTLNRDTLSKKDVPKNIWTEYAKKLSYTAFYFSSKKNKKLL
jgi:hypothetical protein